VLVYAPCCLSISLTVVILTISLTLTRGVLAVVLFYALSCRSISLTVLRRLCWSESRAIHYEEVVSSSLEPPLMLLADVLLRRSAQRRCFTPSRVYFSFVDRRVPPTIKKRAILRFVFECAYFI